MALINTIASVPMWEIHAYRIHRPHVVRASLIRGISSFGMGGWTDPFGLLLQEVMLDGAPIDPALTHDRDIPRFHAPDRVRSLHRRIDDLRRGAPPVSDDPESYDDWVRSELSVAFEVVRRAAEAGECVVTAWEIVGGVRGVPFRIREQTQAEAVLPRLALPLSGVAVVIGATLALAEWRQRRMRARDREEG
ncbi:MAG: hypothetical protein KC657_14525 [Myxococcales bacterium]|nr:hypothetical protein [Myxococcales bacterium]